ncbi:hypothetical protein M378DRAFT_176981 [Amanita muscaria Koide BX008]|uniref:Uncharacterized protein n=1 Tax=Amanita muscaria (strain Koide BX008) TaxID=946122 RepID=A0A0C2X2B2_AMAMK|nr:hypothetical protein M378DRAFT_176981 [Amanita muscaria Koide BX008]
MKKEKMETKMKGKKMKGTEDLKENTNGATPSEDLRENTNGATPSDDLITSFHVVAGYTRLLLCILTSSSFKTHVKVCTRDGSKLERMIPMFKRKYEYQLFAKSMNIKPHGESKPMDDDSSDFELNLDEALEVCKAFPL